VAGKRFHILKPHRTTYNYARRSPEWFDVFIAEGGKPVYGGRRSFEDVDAFKRRDYTAAKNNIGRYVELNFPGGKMDEPDKQKIRDFFEKYWKLFAGEDAGPRVALIKKSAKAVSDSVDIRTYDSYIDGQEGVSGGAYTAEDLIRRVRDYRGVDIQTEKPIEPSSIVIIKLPDCAKVYSE
jgi:hypothetical protein